jgi:hypothetical protein
MDAYETDRDTLEDVLYRRLESLWAPFTDALKVFQKHNASQSRCAQKVWEALLTDFPLDHKRMQTALLARELARMIQWDGDTTRAINLHFSSITELHHTLSFIGDLSMVVIATRASARAGATTSCLSGRRVFLVGHVSASDTREVDAGPAACDRESVAVLIALTVATRSVQIKMQ